MVCGEGGSLEGENESVWWSEMKPCFIIADTSLDFNAFSAAAAAIQSLEKEGSTRDWNFLGKVREEK